MTVAGSVGWQAGAAHNLPDRAWRGGAGPGTGGVFVITYNGERIWDRKADGGFPDAKTLKQRGAPTIRAAMSVLSTARPPGKSRSGIMTERTPPPLAVDPETWRAHQLDALLADTRDVAILIVAFPSGGRRARGGGAAYRAASRRAVCAEASNPRRQNRGVMSARWSHSPTPRPAARPETPCPPHRLPPSWCGRAGSQGTAKGPVFRAIERWGAVADRALTPQSINLIVKRRCAMAGLDPRDYSAHRLRAGYLTEAARRGIALQ